ncbi:MAG: tetratricopeptide repeat protein [Alphaproteobacteria bacterium]|nr:tetratricopeptide repeat protein [Alphaproteobacteria bacterium]
MSRRLSSLVILFGLAAAGLPAAAQDQTRLSELPDGQNYRVCVEMAQEDPEAGFEAAITWRDEGGGPPALHCVALALYGLGQVDEAAARLEELASGMPDASNPERAAIFSQAGNAWLGLGRFDRANAAFIRALELDPSNAEYWIDRGVVRAEMGQLWEAVDDFSEALTRAPGHIDALLFRATAYRLLDAAELARDDVDRVLDMAPTQPSALLELGTLHAQAGEFDDARAVWLQVIEASPESPAADVARAGIERIDVNTGKQQ